MVELYLLLDTDSGLHSPKPESWSIPDRNRKAESAPTSHCPGWAERAILELDGFTISAPAKPEIFNLLWHRSDTTKGTLVRSVTEIVLRHPCTTNALVNGVRAHKQKRAGMHALRRKKPLTGCGVDCPMRLTSKTRPRTFKGQHSLR